jgi:hypothetical protein
LGSAGRSAAEWGSGPGQRIAYRLRTAGDVWSDRFDGDRTNIPVLQDQITARLARSLNVNHKTIADFRKDNGLALRKVCARFVELCH